MELENVKNITINFFDKLSVSIESIDVLKEQEKIFYIKIKTTESSLLIWYSGWNLEDIRVILKHIISKKFWENIILHIEVNDYLSKKEDKLHHFIIKKIEIVKNIGKEIILPYFNAYERKRIHSFVSEIDNSVIYTKSIWEWKDRRIHICKKNLNMSIDTLDMDWVDI